MILLNKRGQRITHLKLVFTPVYAPFSRSLARRSKLCIACSDFFIVRERSFLSKSNRLCRALISSHFKLQVDWFQIATHAKPIKSESFPDRNEVRILYFVTAVEEFLFCHGTKMLMCCGDDRKSGFVNEEIFSLDSTGQNMVQSA